MSSYRRDGTLTSQPENPERTPSEEGFPATTPAAMSISNVLHSSKPVVGENQSKRTGRVSDSSNTVHTNTSSIHLVKPKRKSASIIEALRELTWLQSSKPSMHQTCHRVAVVPTALENLFRVMAITIAEGDIPGPNTTMRYQLLRVSTYHSYPSTNKPYIIRLAQAGFYYAGIADEVVCYVCGLHKRNWCQSDVPMTVHRRFVPNCRFLTHNSEMNVPVPPPSETERTRFACLDLLGSEQVQSMSSEQQRSAGHTSPQVPASMSTLVPRQGNNLRISDERPKSPHYILRSTRLSSFVNWPDNTSQVPETLVDAGFYYAGIGDCVRCFHCGIGIRQWAMEDDVWFEHARWSRNCRYVHTVKGDEFIRLVHLAIEDQDDDEQLAATNGATGNTPPSDEIENIIRSTAAKSVLEMGYQPKTIKKAIENVLARNGIVGITFDMIMNEVLEIEEEQEIKNDAAQLTIADINSCKSNVYSDRRNTVSGRELEPHIDIPKQTPIEERLPSAAAAVVSIEYASSLAIGKNQSQLTGDAIVTTNKALTISSGSHAPGSDALNESNNSAAIRDAPETTKSRETGTPKHKRRYFSNQLHGGTYQSMEVKAASTSTAKHCDTKSIPAINSLKTLREENEALREQMLCTVCMDNMVSVVFLPCGHLVTCEECAPAMRKCPICITMVKKMVKALVA